MMSEVIDEAKKVVEFDKEKFKELYEKFKYQDVILVSGFQPVSYTHLTLPTKA